MEIPVPGTADVSANLCTFPVFVRETAGNEQGQIYKIPAGSAADLLHLSIKGFRYLRADRLDHRRRGRNIDIAAKDFVNKVSWISRACPIVAVRSRLAGANPDASLLSSYFPTGKYANRNRPSASVVTF